LLTHLNNTALGSGRLARLHRKFLHIDKALGCGQNYRRDTGHQVARSNPNSQGAICMSYISRFRVLATMVLLAFAAVIPVRAQNSAAPPAAPDSTLYTTYTLYSSNSQINLNWSVCGSTQETEGCYASGSLGPFVAVGAMMEGVPRINGDVVTRFIYVVDSGSENNVLLYVYKKVDTVSAESDTVTVTLTHTVTLPLTGGSTAKCSMAANANYLFIGSDQSPQGVEVRKSTLQVTPLGGFSPPLNVVAITADQYGYVAVTQANSSGESAFSLFGLNGEEQEDGGGSDFVLGTTQAVLPIPALITGAIAKPRVPQSYRPKASPPQGN
jgi:hypothetical protein